MTFMFYSAAYGSHSDPQASRRTGLVATQGPTGWPDTPGSPPAHQGHSMVPRGRPATTTARPSPQASDRV